MTTTFPALRAILYSLLILAGLRASADLTQSSPTPVYVHLTLEKALFDGDPENHKIMIVDLEWRNGVWGEAFAVARDYNMAFHQGAVRSASQEDGIISLDFGIRFTGDPWKPGGQGEYRVRLSPDAEGRYAGTFEGMRCPMTTRPAIAPGSRTWASRCIFPPGPCPGPIGMSSATTWPICMRR